MTQILVLVGIIIAMTIGVTMYLDQAAQFAQDESDAVSDTEADVDLTPGSGIGSILNSAHTAADQMQPQLDE